MEMVVGSVLPLNPGRRSGLHLFDQICLADSATQSDCQVDVVRRAANPISLGRAVPTNRGKVAMHAWSNGLIQAFLAIFGAEDNMDNDLAERLWHKYELIPRVEL